MRDINPHIATCNHMAQFQETGTWMPINVFGERILTPSGLPIAVELEKLAAIRPMSPEEISEEMKASGQVYIGDRYAQN